MKIGEVTGKEMKQDGNYWSKYFTVLDVDEARADHLVKEGMAEIVKEPAKTAQRKE